MSRNLFIGDLHIGHVGVASKFRKNFSSDAEHDETILHNVRSSLSKRDTLWLLGDTVFKKEKFEMFDSLFRSCQKTNILLGNHCHQDFARFCLNYPSVDIFGVTKKFGMWIQHTPMHPDELYGKPCIHGHLHDKVVDSPWYFCVSCEQVGFKPVSLEEIREHFILRGRL